MNTKFSEQLYLELTSLENRGITVWLEGIPCSSAQIVNQINIEDANAYMRDYVFEEGRLTAVHFDKVSNKKSQ